MRRGSDDKEWQKVKEIIRGLDAAGCIFCRAATATERAIQNRDVKEGKIDCPANFTTLDPAHHIAVSSNAKIMYDPNNVFQVCRFHHTRIDNRQNPYTGDRITAEEQEEFWQRAMKMRNEKPKKAKIPDLFLDDDI